MGRQDVPRYFFHLSHLQDSSDIEGIDLPDFMSAWAEAVRTCGEMLRNLDGSVRPGEPFELTVTDEAGEVLGRLEVTAEFRGH